jgi:double-stranded uracil-DNA glycosylase
VPRPTVDVHDLHLPRGRVPMALAELHHTLSVEARVDVRLFADRPSWRWPEALLEDVVTGAGFAIEAVSRATDGEGVDLTTVRARRLRTLADTVGTGMRLLVCGLNPSVYSTDVGVPFARRGNRFWPAALDAGLVSVDRDPPAALRDHRVGMTDLVKRASPRADELTRDEYRAGVARLERLTAWLRPGAVCFVGLAGWRAAVDRAAEPGPQAVGLGDVPVYVMPSTSGVNARVSPAELSRHLRAAVALADG